QPAPPATRPLSLHDALPIYPSAAGARASARRLPPVPPPDLHVLGAPPAFVLSQDQTLHDKFNPNSGSLHCAVFKEHRVVVQPLRSEEHTSELQSRENLVCRL